MKTRADLVLVARGAFESRSKARAAIEAGQVRANGLLVTKPAELIDPDGVLDIAETDDWVGRGAVKLAHALALWSVPAEGRTVLDIGASTGGFTEVCLRAGAALVYAVDVGHGQLHPRLKDDPRVVDLPGTDARRLDGGLIPAAPDLVVCDASFIGLAKVLPKALDLAASGADLIALVKPQFEVGPTHVGKGGLVRDEAARAKALADVADWLQGISWIVRATAESPITGGDGNAEYLIWAQKNGA